ncbi:hypothetical protein QAD02_019462 [Eretmocerus hayati]|uniref:Uncharacterized protein n=1 Tax=Eretmocerus hayati TaxID=131215 RepID=A0ACC2PPG4_9HYME|nr:hypothetical protein QAD02_019462 [Eretmocerus hayati]
MSRENSNDPRQVLAILNSLGIVGVTAAELKAFMKELKLYRKIKELECQQWKEEVKEKISRQGHLIKQQSYFSKSSKVIDSREPPKSEKKKKVEEPKCCVELILHTENKYDAIGRIKENNSGQSYSNMPLTDRRRRSDRIAKVKKNDVEETVEELQNFDSVCHRTVTDEPQAMQKSKSAPSSASRKSTNPCTRSKSFIRSHSQGCLDSRAQLTKKTNNDPVALYNKYKSIWERLSFPGEETHAKLRWAVREKMLGSEPFPKIDHLALAIVLVTLFIVLFIVLLMPHNSPKLSCSIVLERQLKY